MHFLRLLRALVPVVTAIALVIALEQRVEPFLRPTLRYGPDPIADDPGPPGANAVEPEPPRIRDFRVILDPSHGGRPERKTATTGDAWSPALGRFLAPYDAGSTVTLDGGPIRESEVVLDLSRRVKDLLRLTEDPADWPRFEEILREFAGADRTFEPIRIRAGLTRDHGADDHPAAGDGDVNRYFRLFDSPVSFPATPATPLVPGRLSWLNQTRAHLVVSLHLSFGSSPGMRGTRCLIVPPPSVFERLRRVHLGERALMDELKRSLYYVTWTLPARSPGRPGSMLRDMTRHFMGFVPGSRTAKVIEEVGPPRDRIDWAYRDPTGISVVASLETTPAGPFWDRERSVHEEHRRGQGPEGEGGDNFFASQELLRYVRYALWTGHLIENVEESEWARFTREEADRILGRHLPALCSDWLAPIHVNSVYAHLELGYLTSLEDRDLLLRRRDRYARALAAGIYSLLAGLPVKPVPGVINPRGTRIRWERYLDAPSGGRGPGWFDRAQSPDFPPGVSVDRPPGRLLPAALERAPAVDPSTLSTAPAPAPAPATTSPPPLRPVGLPPDRLLP